MKQVFIFISKYFEIIILLFHCKCVDCREILLIMSFKRNPGSNHGRISLKFLKSIFFFSGLNKFATKTGDKLSGVIGRNNVEKVTNVSY